MTRRRRRLIAQTIGAALAVFGQLTAQYLRNALTVWRGTVGSIKRTREVAT